MSEGENVQDMQEKMADLTFNEAPTPTGLVFEGVITQMPDPLCSRLILACELDNADERKAKLGLQKRVRVTVEIIDGY